MFQIQVLHHLDKTPEGTEFPVLQKALVDTKRILRHRGMLFITTSLPSTIKEAVWFHQVHPGITDKIRKAFISAEQYQNFFTNNGYQCVAAMNLLSVTKQTQLVNYFDHEGPLKTEWRKGTSVYEIATEEELEELEEKLLSIEETQSLQQFMMEHDRTSEMGVLTIFACISVWYLITTRFYYKINIEFSEDETTVSSHVNQNHIINKLAVNLIS